MRNGEGCLRVDPPKTTFSPTKLWPGRTTTYTVVTVNTNGRSAPSNSVTHTTPPDTTPPSPAPVVSLQNAWPTRIAVSWTMARDELTQTWHDLYIDGVLEFCGVFVVDEALPRTANDAYLPGQGTRLLGTPSRATC